MFKSFQENLNQNAILNQSFSDTPMIRNRFTLQSKKESVISKPVSFMENLFGKSLFEGKKREDAKKETNNPINFLITNKESMTWTDRMQQEEENEMKMNEVLKKEWNETSIQKVVSHESIKSSSMAFNENEWNSDEEEGKEEK